ncbi:hypothetical protein EMIT0347P_120021 [Pseudomonas sp. IT-347P]
MKILINLQVGSVRVSALRNTLRIIGRLCCRKIYLETIEGSFPLFSVGLPVRRLTVGMCTTGIDFQLGTNAADTNQSIRVTQTLPEKRLHPPIESASRSVQLPGFGAAFDRRSVKIHSSRRAPDRFLPRPHTKTTRKSASI